MADTDTKQGTAPTGNTPAITPEAVLAARDVLQSAGIYVLEQDAFKGLKGAQAKEAEARATALAAELDALRKQHEIAAGRLREIDDAGKSKEQLWQERQAEWQRQQAEKDAQLEAARKAHAEAMARYQQTLVDQRLSMLLTGAVDLELAVLAAKHRLTGKLAVDDSGRLIHEDLAGVQRIGKDAEAFVGAWWQTQSALRSPPASAGPPTSGGVKGADTAPVEIEPFNPPRGAPLSTQREYARDYQRRLNEAQARSQGH
jgi:hypothetical protein